MDFTLTYAIKNMIQCSSAFDEAYYYAPLFRLFFIAFQHKKWHLKISTGINVPRIWGERRGLILSDDLCFRIFFLIREILLVLTVLCRLLQVCFSFWNWREWVKRCVRWRWLVEMTSRCWKTSCRHVRVSLWGPRDARKSPALVSSCCDCGVFSSYRRRYLRRDRRCCLSVAEASNLSLF